MREWEYQFYPDNTYHTKYTYMYNTRGQEQFSYENSML